MPNQLSHHEATKPLSHNTSHQKGGDDELNLTGLSGKSLYVDRGDPAAMDFIVSDLTTDGSWHELDLSSIVPAGAHAVNMRLAIADNLTNEVLNIREKSNTNNINLLTVKTQVANLVNYTSGIVTCDNDRKIEYNASNTTWTYIGIVVGGWFI